MGERVPWKYSQGKKKGKKCQGANEALNLINPKTTHMIKVNC